MIRSPSFSRSSSSTTTTISPRPIAAIAFSTAEKGIDPSSPSVLYFWLLLVLRRRCDTVLQHRAATRCHAVLRWRPRGRQRRHLPPASAGPAVTTVGRQWSGLRQFLQSGRTPSVVCRGQFHPQIALQASHREDLSLIHI